MVARTDPTGLFRLGQFALKVQGLENRLDLFKFA
jgi:hypothetical protein